MGVGGSGAARQDPLRSDAAQEKFEASSELLACEKRCAQKCWPSAERKPWIGEVTLQMVGIAPDKHKEQG